MITVKIFPSADDLPIVETIHEFTGTAHYLHCNLDPAAFSRDVAPRLQAYVKSSIKGFRMKDDVIYYDQSLDMLDINSGIVQIRLWLETAVFFRA